MNVAKEDLAVTFIEHLFRSVRAQRLPVNMESVGLVLGIADINPVCYAGQYHIYALQDDFGVTIEYLALKDNENPTGTPLGNLTILAQHEFTADINAELGSYLNAHAPSGKDGPIAPVDGSSGAKGADAEDRGIQGGPGPDGGKTGVEGTAEYTREIGTGGSGSGRTESGPQEESEPVDNRSRNGNGDHHNNHGTSLVEDELHASNSNEHNPTEQLSTGARNAEQVEPIAEGNLNSIGTLGSVKRGECENANGTRRSPESAGDNSAQHSGLDHPTPITSKITDEIPISPATRSERESVRSDIGFESTIPGKRTDLHRGAAGIALSIAEQRQLEANKEYLRAEIAVLMEDRLAILSEIQSLKNQLDLAKINFENEQLKKAAQIENLSKTAEAYSHIMEGIDELQSSVEKAAIAAQAKMSEIRKFRETL